MLALYLSVLDDRNFEEDFTEVYNTYKRLVYHTAYKIMDDSYLAEDVLQEVFLYVAKNFSKIHRENCHELAAYLVSCSRSRAYDMLRKQREELLEDVPNEPDAAPVPDDAAVSTDNIEWCCTIKVDIENSKGQYIEKDKQEATKDGSESTKIQHGI